jgi:hypothetical protein
MTTLLLKFSLEQRMKALRLTKALLKLPPEKARKILAYEKTRRAQFKDKTPA